MRVSSHFLMNAYDGWSKLNFILISQILHLQMLHSGGKIFWLPRKNMTLYVNGPLPAPLPVDPHKQESVTMATSKHRSLLVREPSVMDWDAVKFPAVPCRPHTFTSMYLTEDFQPKEVYAPDPWVHLHSVYMSTPTTIKMFCLCFQYSHSYMWYILINFQVNKHNAELRRTSLETYYAIL